MLWVSVFVLMLCVDWTVEKSFLKYKPKSIKRKINTEIYVPHQIQIPVKLHIDKPLYDKYRKKYGSKSRIKLKEAVKKVFANTEKLFRDPILRTKVTLHLMDVKFLRNYTKALEMSENASIYLKNYCRWQEVKKMEAKKMFYSILLTGLDLYYIDNDGRRVQNSAGRSYSSSMCKVHKSCSVMEWKERSMDHVLAHEMAHSMGLRHDGLPYNHCHGSGIMSYRYQPGRQVRGWSVCNAVDLKKFLLSKMSWCLR